MWKLKNALFWGYFWGIWGKRAKVGIWSILYVCATRIYKERVCARDNPLRLPLKGKERTMDNGQKKASEDAFLINGSF